MSSRSRRSVKHNNPLISSYQTDNSSNSALKVTKSRPAPTQKKSKPTKASSALKSGTENWTNDETIALLNIIKAVLPAGKLQWKIVATQLFTQHQIVRDYDQCNTRFQNLQNQAIPVGGKIEIYQQRAIDLDELIRDRYKVSVSNANKDHSEEEAEEAEADEEEEQQDKGNEAEQANVSEQRTEVQLDELEISDFEPNNNNQPVALLANQEEQEEFNLTGDNNNDSVQGLHSNAAPQLLPLHIQLIPLNTPLKRKAQAESSSNSGKSQKSFVASEINKLDKFAQMQSDSRKPDYTGLAMIVAEMAAERAAQREESRKDRAESRLASERQSQQFMLMFGAIMTPARAAPRSPAHPSSASQQFPKYALRQFINPSQL